MPLFPDFDVLPMFFLYRDWRETHVEFISEGSKARYRLSLKRQHPFKTGENPSFSIEGKNLLHARKSAVIEIDYLERTRT